MKKSLLALAAMGAFAGAAQAQSSVSVYGIMDGSYTATENKQNLTLGAATGVIQQRNTVNGDGAYSTSRLGFRGVEDIGGGQRAEFQLEYDLINIGNGANGTDTAYAQSSNTNGRTASFGARYSWIGIADKNLGGLRIGRQETAMHGAFTNGLAGQANNMPGSIYSAGTGTTGSTIINATARPYDVFIDQAITYLAPTVVNGLSAQVQYSQNAYSAATTTPSQGFSQFGANIRYTGVKNLSLAYGFWQTNSVVLPAAEVAATAGNAGTAAVTGANIKNVAHALTANYNFGPVTAFALGSKLKITNQTNNEVNRDQSAYEFGLRAPVSKVIEVWGSMFTGDRTMTQNNANLTSTATAALATTPTGRADLTGFQLGAQYNFSKRTTAYAIFGEKSVKGKQAASGTKIESSGYAVGLRHTF